MLRISNFFRKCTHKKLHTVARPSQAINEEVHRKKWSAAHAHTTKTCVISDINFGHDMPI